MSGSGDDPRSGDAVVSGVAGAAGRDTFVGGQIGQAERAARAQPAVSFSGEVYRAVDPAWVTTYADHSFSGPGRYNAVGQSTVYTAAGLPDLRAETANYGGLDGKAVVRSDLSATMLDLRDTPGVTRGALTEGYGDGGKMKNLLGQVTGEDPYTLPRALGDVARGRDLSGVIAPANKNSTNVNLFPDDPNAAAVGTGRVATGLRPLDIQSHVSGAPAAPVPMDPSYRAVPDMTPNRRSPAVAGEPAFTEAVTADAGAHGRAGGARYGAAGAVAADLVTGALGGSIDGRKVTADTAVGAALGHAETKLAVAADHLMGSGAGVAPRIAGNGATALEASGASALHPPSLVAGVGAAGVIGGLVNGGVAGWQDADLVKTGRMTAGRATADVAVQTGVGLAAGASGAAAGAAVGSAVPVVGTAAGAVVGFGVGVGVSYVAQHSNAIHRAEHAAGDYLTAHFEKPLQQAWHPVTEAVDATRSAVSRGADAAAALAKEEQHALGNAVASGQAAAHDAMTRLAGLFGPPSPHADAPPSHADYWRDLPSRHVAPTSGASAAGPSRSAWNHANGSEREPEHKAAKTADETAHATVVLRR